MAKVKVVEVLESRRRYRVEWKNHHGWVNCSDQMRTASAARAQLNIEALSCDRDKLRIVRVTHKVEVVE